MYHDYIRLLLYQSISIYIILPTSTNHTSSGHPPCIPPHPTTKCFLQHSWGNKWTNTVLLTASNILYTTHATPRTANAFYFSLCPSTKCHLVSARISTWRDVYIGAAWKHFVHWRLLNITDVQWWSQWCTFMIINVHWCTLMYIVILWGSLTFLKVNSQILSTFPDLSKTHIVECCWGFGLACCILLRLSLSWFLKSFGMLLEDSVVVGPVLQRRLARQYTRENLKNIDKSRKISQFHTYHQISK